MATATGLTQGEINMYHITRFNNARSKNNDVFTQLARDFFGYPLANAISSTGEVSHSPRFDFVESDSNYTLTADLPGISEENLDITLHEGVLAIHGTRELETLEEGSSVLVREREFGEFTRSIKLPENANADTVQASLDAGVLRVTIDKKEEVKARKIKLG